jgi:hypothetical protein
MALDTGSTIRSDDDMTDARAAALADVRVAHEETDFSIEGT